MKRIVAALLFGCFVVASVLLVSNDMDRRAKALGREDYSLADYWNDGQDAALEVGRKSRAEEKKARPPVVNRGATASASTKPKVSTSCSNAQGFKRCKIISE